MPLVSDPFVYLSVVFIHSSISFLSHSNRYRMDPIDKALNDALSSLSGPVLKLKAKQREAILSILRRLDTFVVLPTGFGKSLIFFLLPRVMDSLRHGVCKEPMPKTILLVVSLLIALMDDQVDRMQKLGLSAVHWTNNLRDSDRVKVAEGKFEIVLLSPEASDSAACRSILQSAVYRRNVKCIVIDEAHCVLTW